MRHPVWRAFERVKKKELARKLQAVAEAQVVIDVPVDVEAVAVGEVAVVAVPGTVHQHHDLARAHGLAVVLDVALHGAGLHR